jgi:hypothetical protein
MDVTLNVNTADEMVAHNRADEYVELAERALGESLSERAQAYATLALVFETRAARAATAYQSEIFDGIAGAIQNLA